MRTHNYLMRLDDQIWLDLKRVQKLDNRSINSLLNEGGRMVCEEKKNEMVRQRKTRNTLSAATGL